MFYDLIIIITAVINTAVNILRAIGELHQIMTKKKEK